MHWLLADKNSTLISMRRSASSCQGYLFHLCIPAFSINLEVMAPSCQEELFCCKNETKFTGWDVSWDFKTCTDIKQSKDCWFHQLWFDFGECCILCFSSHSFILFTDQLTSCVKSTKLPENFLTWFIIPMEQMRSAIFYGDGMLKHT